MQAAPFPEAAPTPGANQPQGALASSAPRRALAGFFVSGVLLAFLGAILPAWQHHLTSDYSVVGFYFAGLIAGLLCAIWPSCPRLFPPGGVWVGWRSLGSRRGCSTPPCFTQSLQCIVTTR